MVAKLWYLKKIALFSTLDQSEIEKLSEMTRMDTIEENQTIYFPGDDSDTIYMLKRGRVKIVRNNPSGKKITLAILEPGEIFGELALTDEEKRNTRAETIESSYICAASRDKFLSFINENPELSFDITQMIGDRRREIESKIENLIFKDAEGRLKYILLDLFEGHYQDSDSSDGTPDETDRSISFSHQEIADLAGLTRPTTTNLLNRFQDEGLIELGRKKIHLTDPYSLKSEVENE